MSPRQKKILKTVMLVLVLVVLTGCTSNLDSDGNLIAERAITSSTSWSLDAGFFDFICVIPIAKCILFFEQYTGVTLAVIITTIIVNIILLPFNIKSTVNQQRMTMIQPKIEAIQRKYQGRNDKNSQMRMSAELNALYKKNNVSMGASFLTFLTLPIMIGMYYAVQRIEILYSTTFLGINLGDKPMDHITEGEINYIILIVLLGVAQFGAMKITEFLNKRKKGYRPSQQSNQMKIMNYVMLAMIVVFGLQMPSAMSIYWITTSTITIVRTVFIDYFYKDKNEEKDTYLTKPGNNTSKNSKSSDSNQEKISNNYSYSSSNSKKKKKKKKKKK